MRLQRSRLLELQEKLGIKPAAQTQKSRLSGIHAAQLRENGINLQRYRKAKVIVVLSFLQSIKTELNRALLVPSVWFITAFIVLLILEIPIDSGRVLERFAGYSLVGWLGQCVFVVLAIDSLRAAIPRAFIIIPALFYSSYYFAFWDQGTHIALKSSQLRRTNPGRIVDFDPRSCSLVMEKADLFAASHFVPVVYTRDSSYVHDEYVSYRLVARDKIKQYLLKNDSDVQILSVYWNDIIQPNVKELKFPERPKHCVVSIAVRDDPAEGWKDFNIGVETTSARFDGRVVGEFKSAYVDRLPVVPLFTMGCRSFTNPTRRLCEAYFRTERMEIESRPDSVKALYDDPVSIMLGIKPLSRSEIADFRSSGGDIPPRAAPGDIEALDVLRDVIAGRSAPLPWTTGFLISGDSARLAPFATDMVKRFLELVQVDNADLPGLHEQASLMATGIAALGPAEFAREQGRLADLVQRDGLLNEYPLLHLRLADAGPRLYPIYRDQFLAQGANRKDKLLAALAICRIGQGDSELLSAIKSEWSEPDEHTAISDNYKAALFVALLKLGQESYLRASVRSNIKILQDWYDAVLADHGKTDVGPNNCMPLEWPMGNIYVPPYMAPRLQWVQQQWRANE
jgi:hypothetical protein